MYTAWCDGATYRHIKQSCIGYIIVDPNGNVIRRYSDRVPYSPFSATIESAALRECLVTLIQLGIDNVTIYTDCKGLIDGIRSTTQVKHILVARSLLEQIPNATLKWIPRSQNRVADRLSKLPRKERRLVVV
jgi:ribonuclease HI